MDGNSETIDRPAWLCFSFDATRLKLHDATRTMVGLTVFCGVTAAALIGINGLTFPAGDLFEPAGTCAALLALAAFYQAVRPAENFVLVLKSLCVLVAFSSVYSVLMYAVATCRWPLADSMLARADAALGLSAPAVVRFVGEHRGLALFMWLAYFSLIPQMILAIVWLGLANDREHLDKFLLQFILGSLITLVGFYFWPAHGTYGDVYRLPVPDYCRRCVEHLDALRAGARTVISWRETEGLITFPSFHTTWAVLLVAAFSGSRMCWPVALWNVVVVASTVTTGMHYFSDVLAGLAVCGVVIWATKDRPRELDPATSGVGAETAVGAG
jgi:membrane-associated phospholipid phosphatase